MYWNGVTSNPSSFHQFKSHFCLYKFSPYSISFFVSLEQPPALCDSYILLVQQAVAFNLMVHLCSFGQGSLCCAFSSFCALWLISNSFSTHQTFTQFQTKYSLSHRCRFTPVLYAWCLFLKPICYLSSHISFPPPARIFLERSVSSFRTCHFCLCSSPFPAPFPSDFPLCCCSETTLAKLFSFLKHLSKPNNFLPLCSTLFSFCLPIFFHHCSEQFKKIYICHDGHCFIIYLEGSCGLFVTNTHLLAECSG